MGISRAGNKDKKNKEVQYKIMKEFNVDYDTLYEVWLIYCAYIAQGISNVEAVNKIKSYDIDKWNKSLNFFISYGMNVVSFKIDEGLKIYG